MSTSSATLSSLQSCYNYERASIIVFTCTSIIAHSYHSVVMCKHHSVVMCKHHSVKCYVYCKQGSDSCMSLGHSMRKWTTHKWVRG